MATTNLTRYLESSPPLFEAVFWASAVLLVAILLMVLGILLSRLRYIYLKRRRERIRRNWIPVFIAVRDGKEIELPRVRRGEMANVLELWVDYRSHASAAQAATLDALASRLNLASVIEDILRPAVLNIVPPPIWLKRIALTAVQWLNSDSIMRYVYEAADSDNLYLAVNACACLTRLKAESYEQEIVTLLFRFPDQSGYITAELRQAGATEVLQLMEPFIDDLPDNVATNFLALADFSRDRELLPLLTRRINKAASGRELAILIRTIGRLGDSNYRDLVAPYLDDERYYVRIQAIKALGRTGNSDDIPLLLPFLSDREWWVRYRAARAIIRLSDRDEPAIAQLRSGLNDRYAKDILMHAITEMNWCHN